MHIHYVFLFYLIHLGLQHCCFAPDGADADDGVAEKNRHTDKSNSRFDDDTNVSNHDNAASNDRTNTLDNEETDSSIPINNFALAQHQSEITSSRDNAIRSEHVHDAIDDSSSANTRTNQHAHNTKAVIMEMHSTHTPRDNQACEADNSTSQKPVIYDDIRLPPALRPSLYEIKLLPHIYSNDPDTFSYQCETIIHIDCINSTDQIIIHCVDHNITSISIQSQTDIISSENDVTWCWNDKFEMLQIHPSHTLISGHVYIVTIHSSRSISDSLRGLYYSPYKQGDQTRYIFTTIMEPTYARRVFPCFDEPDFKAVFIFNIKRKTGLTSVTNLPKRITTGPDDDGYFTDIFDEPRNIRMSSYLVAIVIGELDHLASSVNNVTFRTWSRKSTVNQTRYALEIGMEFMKFFEDYFQIPYALPKEDMIAVPTMSFSGMEHWGLITYRENRMLYEEGVSSLSDKELMTIIIAHEVAHQWFGNLVSPFWWDDLWLNEGFATYMMFLAVDRVLPSWNMINKLIVDSRGVQHVMAVDDDHHTHPVYVSVHDPDEIFNIFDIISYAKGGSVIRMMHFFLGEDTFRRGLTRYLKKFRYRTATHNDLWLTLSEQARLDNHINTDVKAVMDSWVLEQNYPVVKVTRNDDVTITLTQSAFLETEEQRLNRHHVLWEIPFVYTTNVEGNFDKTFTDIKWLTNRTLSVTDIHLRNASWIIGNIQQYGFYRVNYDTDNWDSLLNQLLSDHTVIHVINRAQIINDAWNLARAGLLDMKIALRTVEYIDSELDFVPWKAALRELNYIKTSLMLTPIYGQFQAFMRKKLKKTYYVSAEASSQYDRLHYSMIFKAACDYGLRSCIDDAMERFYVWKHDPNISIDPDLKDTVYCIGVKYGGEAAWQFVLHKFNTTESTSEKKCLLDALTCVDEPWLINRLAEVVFRTNIFSNTEKINVLTGIPRSPTGRLLAWMILVDYWSDICHEYGDNVNMLLEVITSVTIPFNTQYELDMVKTFVRDRDDLGTAGVLFTVAAEYIEAKVEWMAIYYDTIKFWLTNIT